MSKARHKRRRRPGRQALDFEQRLKLGLSALRRLSWLLAFERRAPQSLSLRVRWRAFRMGFASTSWVLYALDRNDPELYVRDFAHQDYAVLERHRAAIREKLSFSLLMRSLGALHPQPLALLQEGRLRNLKPPFGGLTIADLLEQDPSVVFRPVAGWGGKGVFFVHRGPEGLTVDGQPIDRESLEARLRSLGEYLITAFVAQADYAATIYDGSPNTLRLLTLWDLETDRPFLAAAAHRFGRAGGERIDNFHRGLGGLSAPIDLETGSLGPVVYLDANHRRAEADRHPDTGSPIAGVAMPHWHATVDKALEVAAALPQFPYVGWDLLMTDDGAYWLEANSPPGLAVWQAHGPLLADPRARRFFDWLG